MPTLTCCDCLWDENKGEDERKGKERTVEHWSLFYFPAAPTGQLLFLSLSLFRSSFLAALFPFLLPCAAPGESRASWHRQSVFYGKESDGEQSEKQIRIRERESGSAVAAPIDRFRSTFAFAFLSLSLCPSRPPKSSSNLAGHGKCSVDVKEGDGLRHCGRAAERGEEGKRASFGKERERKEQKGRSEQ